MNLEGFVPTEYRPGVGVMLLNNRGRVLICRRNDIEGGAWQMPQGGVDRGENLRMAALRELKEEIGTDNATLIAESRGWYQYDLPQAIITRTWGGKYLGQRQKWFLMRFNGRDDEIKLDMQHPEFDEWIWALPDELPDLVVAFKRNVYQSLLDEFRSHCLPVPR
jgi:putative (di)nucleoside polyphosphate hydrolase